MIADDARTRLIERLEKWANNMTLAPMADDAPVPAVIRMEAKKAVEHVAARQALLREALAALRQPAPALLRQYQQQVAIIHKAVTDLWSGLDPEQQPAICAALFAIIENCGNPACSQGPDLRVALRGLLKIESLQRSRTQSKTVEKAIQAAEAALSRQGAAQK